MKLSEKTKAILTNFGAINQSMLIVAGNRQRTMNIPSKSILADATLDETFPIDFGIYKLDKFLQLLSLFSDPDLDFGDKFVTFSEGVNKATFTYYEAKLIKAPPKGVDIPFKNPVVSFELTNEVFNKLQKAGKILSNQDLVLEADGENMFFTVKNNKDSSADTFVEILGPSTETFKYGFDIDVLKFIPSNYDVVIADNNMSKFSSKDMNLTYWLPTQKA